MPEDHMDNEELHTLRELEKWTAFPPIMMDRGSVLVTLDIEGVLFKTRISTLTRVSGTFFDKLFAGDWRRNLNKEGHIFIDRDATVFPIILNFLRDGPKIPLPTDEFFLRRIQHEADYFGIYPLVDLIDRILHVSPPPFKPPQPPPNPQRKQSEDKNNSKKTNSAPRQRKNSHENRKEKTVTFEPRPMLHQQGQRRHSIELPQKRSEKKHGVLKKNSSIGNSVESISLPRNFTHIAHVGWNGTGIIFEKNLLNNDAETVKAIIDEARRHDLTPVYNVINGDSEDYGSHGIEIVLAGPHMKSKEQNIRDKPGHRQQTEQNVNRDSVKLSETREDRNGRESSASRSSQEERTGTQRNPKRPPKPAPKPQFNRGLIQSTF